MVDVIEEVARHCVWREVFLALRSFAVFDGATEVAEVAELWPLAHVGFVQMLDDERVGHQGERLAQTLGFVLYAHLPQLLVESLHRHLGDTLQYVVDTIRLTCIIHERAVNHRQAEALAPRLLEDEHHLGYLRLSVRIGEVESTVPSFIDLQHVEQRLHLGADRASVLGTLDEGMYEHLQQVVSIGSVVESFGEDVQQIIRLLRNFHAQRRISALLNLFLILFHLVYLF